MVAVARFSDMGSTASGSSDRLPACPDVRVSEIFSAATRIWETRDDLRSGYGSITNPEYWIWLAWHGLDEYESLRASWFEVPPPHLLERCSFSDPSPRAFLRSGAVDWRRCIEGLQRCGVAAESAKLIELGTSCGRVLRYFGRYAATGTFTGLALDPDGAAWCREHLTFAHFLNVAPFLPCGLRAGAFDAVIVPELFHSLVPAAQRAWIDEAARLLRPGGALVATYLGARVVERWIAGEAPRGSPRPTDLAEELPRLREEGSAYFIVEPFESAHPENAQWARHEDASAIGTTFLTREYVEREWTSSFELVELLEAPDGWQDFAYLRRR
ncbi:MAG: class I SAM-dependent methyltransferase [Planctomycetes bacterium]|nr:class I SAM-dependent methyltransferase [Planctomycetota bacterium]